MFDLQEKRAEMNFETNFFSEEVSISVSESVTHIEKY